MTVSHFSVFLRIQICAVFGPDKLSERGWIGRLARHVDCFDEIPALKAIYASSSYRQNPTSVSRLGVRLPIWCDITRTIDNVVLLLS